MTPEELVRLSNEILRRTAMGASFENAYGASSMQLDLFANPEEYSALVDCFLVSLC